MDDTVVVASQPKKCPVCFLVLSNPVCFSCGHTICFECFHKIKTGKCPECRADIIIDPVPTMAFQETLTSLMRLWCQTLAPEKGAEKLEEYLRRVEAPVFTQEKFEGLVRDVCEKSKKGYARWSEIGKEAIHRFMIHIGGTNLKVAFVKALTEKRIFQLPKGVSSPSWINPDVSDVSKKYFHVSQWEKVVFDLVKKASTGTTKRPLHQVVGWAVMIANELGRGDVVTSILEKAKEPQIPTEMLRSPVEVSDDSRGEAESDAQAAIRDARNLLNRYSRDRDAMVEGAWASLVQQGLITAEEAAVRMRRIRTELASEPVALPRPSTGRLAYVPGPDGPIPHFTFDSAAAPAVDWSDSLIHRLFETAVAEICKVAEEEGVETGIERISAFAPVIFASISRDGPELARQYIYMILDQSGLPVADQNILTTRIMSVPPPSAGNVLVTEIAESTRPAITFTAEIPPAPPGDHSNASDWVRHVGGDAVRYVNIDDSSDDE